MSLTNFSIFGKDCSFFGFIGSIDVVFVDVLKLLQGHLAFRLTQILPSPGIKRWWKFDDLLQVKECDNGQGLLNHRMGSERF